MSALSQPRCINPVCEEPQALERVQGPTGHWRCAGCGEVFTSRALGRAYGKATGQWLVLGAVLGGVGYPMAEPWHQGAAAAAGALGLWVVARVFCQWRFLRANP